MKISERLALLKAGYSKEEISALIDDELKEEPQENDKAPEDQKVDDFMTVITALADEVKGLKKAVQTQNLQDTKVSGNDSGPDEIDKILQSIINPQPEKEGEK